MTTVAVVTDTDASLPGALAARYGIRQVPITIHFGQEVLYSGVDVDDTQLFARIDREGSLPTTAAPAPGAFMTAFQQAFDEGADEVACFCVSSQISATYAAACTARDELAGRTIRVIDTQSLSMGQGFMALAAAEAARAGASLDEVVDAAMAIQPRTYLYAALSTLRYLAMSGRVGGLAAGMANLLHIKPILTLRDGRLDLLEKVRTQRRSWVRVMELLEQALDGRSIERLAMLHVCAPEDECAFRSQVLERIPFAGQVIVAELSPGLSVHAGAGVVGACVVASPPA